MAVSLRLLACQPKCVLTWINKLEHVEYGSCAVCLAPCMHAYAAIGFQNLKLEDFVYHSLSKVQWELTYENYIQAVPSEEYWAKSVSILSNHHQLRGHLADQRSKEEELLKKQLKTHIGLRESTRKLSAASVVILAIMQGPAKGPIKIK